MNCRHEMNSRFTHIWYPRRSELAINCNLRGSLLRCKHHALHSTSKYTCALREHRRRIVVSYWSSSETCLYGDIGKGWKSEKNDNLFDSRIEIDLCIIFDWRFQVLHMNVFFKWIVKSYTQLNINDGRFESSGSF